MDVAVNFKLTPQEYGTVVRALDVAREAAKDDRRNTTLTHELRAAARREEAEIGLLLAKLSPHQRDRTG
jgi:hypothetical protein